MKLKKEYLILLIIIVAAGGYLYTQKADRVHYSLPDLTALDKDKIVRLSIQRPQEKTPLVLEKTNDQWQLQPEGFRADQAKIETMLSALADLELTALVATAAQDHDRYGLSPEKTLSVSAESRQEKTLRHLQVGKKGPSRNHTFVQLPDAPKVYLASGRLQQTFDKTAGDLRDKTVLRFDPAYVRQIELTKDETTVRWQKTAHDKEKAAPVWRNDNGDPAPEKAVDELLQALADLNCQKFLSQGQKAQLEDPVWTISLAAETDHRLSLFVSPTGDPDADNQPQPPRAGISSQTESAFLLTPALAQTIVTNSDRLLSITSQK